MCTFTQEPVLDTTTLRAYLPDQPADAIAFLSMLEETYASSSAACLEALRAACATCDEVALRKAAHSFKGACLSLGATELARMLEALEHPVTVLTWDVAGGLVAQVERASASVPRGFAALKRSLEA